MAMRVKDLNVVTTRMLVARNCNIFYKELGLGVGVVVNNEFIGITRAVSTPVVEKNKYNRDILESIPTGGIYATDIYKVGHYDYYRPRNQRVTLGVINDIIKDLKSKGHDVIEPNNGEEVTKEEFEVWQYLTKEATRQAKTECGKSKVLKPLKR